MMVQTKYKIGEFSRLGKVTVRTLRHYEKYDIADAPRACYVDGIWNQEDPEKWLTIIQVPVRKSIPY